MNEENQTFITAPDTDTHLGQTMYIHLPEGAVIVDRSNVNTVGVPTAEPVTTAVPAPQVQFIPPQPAVQYISEQPQVNFVNAQPGLGYIQMQPQMQPGIIYMQTQPQIDQDLAYVQAQQQMQSGVSYIGGNPNQPGVVFVQGQPGVHYANAQPPLGYRRRRRGEHLVLRRKNRLDWVHSLTIAFAAYIIIIAIVPVMLSAFFGIALYSAKASHAELTINRGELMVTHMTPVARLIPGDPVLLREKNSWNLQVRQLGSTNTIGVVTTISTISGLNATSSDVLTMDSATPVRNITSAVPFFGYVVTFFSSILVQLIGAALILYLNLRHQMNRRRLRTIDEKVVFVAKHPDQRI